MDVGIDTDRDGSRDKCSMGQVLKFLAREWLAHVIRALGDSGELHFGALRRALPPGVSARMLTARLKELQSLGLVARRQENDALRKVRYSLTGDGIRLDHALRRLQEVLEATPLPGLLRQERSAELAR
ncbi:winged helix-turn-helix transcriptional regulator [Roseococcus sp. YIM B11640]|uniref:winged helix-turn-helix transcriptional regulator n=1 Tax=Roseococcus sp. YIM B11640 TaxID=3133973 RepID=UPI003C7E4998